MQFVGAADENSQTVFEVAAGMQLGGGAIVTGVCDDDGLTRLIELEQGEEDPSGAVSENLESLASSSIVSDFSASREGGIVVIGYEDGVCACDGR